MARESGHLLPASRAVFVCTKLQIMKTKTVTIEEQEFTIARLTVGQVEDMLDGQQPAAGDVKAWRDRARNSVVQSITNAGGALTADAIRSSMDLVTFNALHAAVLEFSGLKAVTAGESEAAAESTSSTSAVA